MALYYFSEYGSIIEFAIKMTPTVLQLLCMCVIIETFIINKQLAFVNVYIDLAEKIVIEQFE